MLKKFFTFIKSPTSKNIFINTLGNYLNIFFTAFFAFLLVRLMSPIEYGTLSILLGIAYVLANILDLGISASIYSFLPEFYEKKTDRLFSFLKTTFFYQSFFATVVAIFLFIFFPYLDKIFFKTFAPWWELYLTVFSVIFLIWQNYALNSLIAIKKVFQAQVFLNLSNLLKTIFIFVLIFTKTANIAMILFVFGIFGPAVFFFFLFWQKRNVVYKIVKAPIRGEEFKFSYTLTYFLASQFFNLGTRMDLFLLSFYFPKTAVLGYYGLSTKIILTLFAAVSSVTQVLSPDFSKIKKYSDLKTLFKKSLLFLSIPTLLFFLLFLTPKEIFQIAFTEKFTKTVQITHLLSLAYLIYPILNIPLLFFLYTEKKPKFILIANTVFFITISLSCFYLIPKLNFYAGPLSVFLALFLSGVYLFYKFIKIIKNDRGIIA